MRKCDGHVTSTVVATGEPLATMPVDSHVHSAWSWDAPNGSMERSCCRADDPTLDADHPFVALSAPDGRVTPPAFDAMGYLTSVERCRE
jgi:histidinol-phosphatase (PHP family)